MVNETLTIQNELGLHARAASKLVNLASRFESETKIIVISSEISANCKSIMGLMTLDASYGTVVKVVATGVDKQNALNEIISLINNKFGEN